MAQIKKDTSLRKAILQAAITGQLISTVVEPVETTGGESDVLFSNEKKSKTKLDSEADLPLAAAGKPSSATPSAGTPRNAPTETGKQLLDRIIEERNNKLLAEWEETLKKNPKAKKPAPVVASEIDEEELPFEIPENWCWCKLEDLVTILGDGLHGTPQYDISGEYYFVNGNNLNNGLIEIKPDTKKVNKKEYDKYKKELNETTIFVSINGTIGNIAFYNYEKIILGKSACYFNVAIEDLKKYFFYLFQTDFFLNYALDNATGTTIKNVGLGTMRNFLLPLPPLSVQNAIVAKLEQVLPLVDAYENAVLQKEELKSALPDKVKKAILQEAITGKLTETWRKSATIKENGKQLLDRIIEERNAKALVDWEEALKKNPKAKKPADIVASEIDEEEIPFEVPESWCWCRLGDVIDLLSGRDLEPSAYNSISKGIPYMTGASNFVNEELIVNRWTDKPVTISSLGDLLITCKGTIGELAFNHVGDVHIARQIMAIRKTDYINLKFLKFFLMSRVDEIQKQAKSMIPGISREDMIGFYFPLPPLEEQEEIVKKVEELLPLCKNIK